MELTPKELATILAALRHWQATVIADANLRIVKEEHLHFTDIDPMNDVEVDDLCERLNTKPTRCCSHSHCTIYTNDPSGLCAGHRPRKTGNYGSY